MNVLSSPHRSDCEPLEGGRIFRLHSSVEEAEGKSWPQMASSGTVLTVFGRRSSSLDMGAQNLEAYDGRNGTTRTYGSEGGDERRQW
eukprot:4730743-Amphidinium_carterae.1